MAIDFPNSPALNDYFESNGKAWTFNGTSWDIVQTPANLSIANESITAAKLASGAAVTNIGYTPANVSSPTFTGTVTLPSTTSIGTVSSTEIGYVDGVTSAIQTQLDSKLTATTAVTSNRNKIINGGMSVWQRGTSFADPANMTGYTADRWAAVWGTTGRTFSRQAGFANSQYCLRVQRNSGSTGTSLSGIAQIFETVNSVPLQGKNVTLSFNARCGANFSPTSNLLGVTLYTGTGTNQTGSTFYATGWTGQVNVINSNVTLSTTSQRFTFTGSIPSNATQIVIYIYFTPTGTAGAADHFEITNVQLEEGSVATPFEFEDYGTTLAKCQRYYCRLNGGFLGSGMCFSTSAVDIIVNFPSTMRVAPSAVETTGTSANYYQVTSNTGTQASNSGPSFVRASVDTAEVTTGSASTFLTQGNATFLLAVNGSVYLGFSAEL